MARVLQSGAHIERIRERVVIIAESIGQIPRFRRCIFRCRHLEKGRFRGCAGGAADIGAYADDSVVKAEYRLACMQRPVIFVVAVQFHAPRTLSVPRESVAERLIALQHFLKTRIHIRIFYFCPQRVNRYYYRRRAGYVRPVESFLPIARAEIRDRIPRTEYLHIAIVQIPPV